MSSYYVSVPPLCVSHLPTVPLELSRYAEYLKAVYANFPIARPDKFVPFPSMVYVKLALVKKEKVSRAEADRFTRLTLQGDIDLILNVKEEIKIDEILKEDGNTRLVVVEGAPGIGKSTLAWELCRQWHILKSLKRFSLIVLLRLREEGVRSASSLKDIFPCEDDPGLSSLVAERIRGGNGRGVLFIFDGFDELPADLRKSLDLLVIKVISGTLLPKATVLVTSRPSATADLQSAFYPAISKRIEVVGFAKNEIQEYVESVFGSRPEVLASFNAYLSVNPVVKGMMYNPLNCAIVTAVYQETSESGKPIPHTQTQLYTELTLCLLSRYLSAAGDSLATQLPDRLDDLPHGSDIYQQLVNIGKLAFDGRIRGTVIFKQLPEGCSDLGLLVEHRALYTRKETTTFNFFHLTLQEYMSAFYISQLPANEQKTLFLECSETLNVVWKFVAGMTKMRDIGWDMFYRVERKKKHDSLTEEMTAKTLISSQDGSVYVDTFVIRCLYEAQDVQSCGNVFGLCTVEFTTDTISNYDLFALGYCISECSNVWLLQLVVSELGLEMLGHGMRSVEYHGGTIDDLNLTVSVGVINEGENLLHLPHIILQDIKSLNLSGCGIDQRGFDNLCIPYLCNLTSLNISENPNCVGSVVKLFQALKKHGKLESLDITDIPLGSDDTTALFDLVQSSGCLRDLRLGFFTLKSIGDVQTVDFVQTVSPGELVRTLLLPSSLQALSFLRFPTTLNDIVTISDNIHSLYLQYDSCLEDESLPASSDITSQIKGGTKLSHILRTNTSLRQLALLVPLDEEELHDILHSLNANCSLEVLVLSDDYHSEYFSELEQEEIDPRIEFD